jgi:hypothetical protein
MASPLDPVSLLSMAYMEKILGLYVNASNVGRGMFENREVGCAEHSIIVGLDLSRYSKNADS